MKQEFKTLLPYLQGKTQYFENDGHIGIPYAVTVYYDQKMHGAARPGFMTLGATPVILYVINANVERIGRASDEKIIGGMLARGYAVAVLDYLNRAEAKSPMLDSSALLLRARLSKGDFFEDKEIFPYGTYVDSAIVPAGYDITMNHVFFSLDRHGTHGTLEKIVNVWNHDFRMYKKEKTVKWIHSDGTRKATQKGFDGSDPVWYADADGACVDMENGAYTRIEFTDAQLITDCVKADGTPIDLDLYLHVTYPREPEKKVPVMAMFASTGTASEGNANPTRPQFAGFLFRGYAAAVFDYAWIPMGRSDHYGYFDGSSGEGRSVTGDNMSYATYPYNATQTVTAALRYLRYLALSDPRTYCFDINKVGSYGISKASWATQLGAPALRENLLTPQSKKSDAEIAEHVNRKINSFVQMYYLDECDGSTRYDMGLTNDCTHDGFTVRGGELQPWAVWNGYEISSGAQMVYSCCGGFVDYLCPTYAPLFITENLMDTCHTEYGQQNILVNLCRNLNIPSLWFEAEIAHTFAIGNDARYGVDIYDAFFGFADYYLKDASPQVVYTTPADGGCIRPSEPITLRLIGSVSKEEIEKVRITSADGSALKGIWRSAYGETEWSFLPYHMKGNTVYTLNLPAEVKAANGIPFGKDTVVRFSTSEEEILSLSEEKVSVNQAGYVLHFTAPEARAERYVLRVRVENNAANLLVALDAETLARIGCVRVSGVGFYEIDVTEAIANAKHSGCVAIRLKTETASGNVCDYEACTETGNGGFSPTGDTVFSEGHRVGDKHALAVIRKPNVGKYKGGHVFYHNMEGALTMTHDRLINGGKPIAKADMGRRFLIRLRLFDRISRPIRFWMNNATSRAEKRLDFDRVYYTFETRAMEWCEYEIPYTVYESKYGIEEQVKTLYVQFTPTGSLELPVWVNYVRSEEVFTDVILGEVALIS